METIFVTGTDTNVGKTYVSCLLIQKLRDAGVAVGAYKPVCSGAEPDLEGNPVWSDVAAMQLATGNEFPVEWICPQRFLAAVAPNIAAELEGTSVSGELLFDGYAAWRGKVEALLVEGAGGVFCPLSRELSVLDLAIRIHAPVIVVAANRLGVISQTRLTVERLHASGLHVAAIILNDLYLSETADTSMSTNAKQLMHWIPDVAVLHVRFQAKAMSYADGSQALTNSLLVRIVES